MRSVSNPARVKRNDLVEQLANFDEEIGALGPRLEALKLRTSLTGSAVESALKADLDALEREIIALDTRRAAMKRQLADHRPEDEPGPMGWIARRHWSWGILLGLVVPTTFMFSFYRASIADRADLRYYESVAQVLPVLLLAVALESRVLRASFGPPMVRAHYGVFLLVMAAGEAAALEVLATGQTSAVAFGLAGAGLVVALQTMIVVIAQAAVD